MIGEFFKTHLEDTNYFELLNIYSLIKTQIAPTINYLSLLKVRNASYFDVLRNHSDDVLF